jgi:hypothetical protein
MSVQYGGDKITFSDGSTVGSGWSGFKNRIINGAMMIDQRNAGASVTPSSGSSYTLDRWKNYNSQASKLSFQQNAGSVTPPAGFTNYLGATSLSAYSVGSSDEFDLYQLIEGLNVSDLGWGTASASTVTLSFWVRSSLTGTFGGSIQNSGGSRNYPFSYTISATNTWEQKTITVAGDTSGTWLTTNGVGISLLFSLGAGSSVVGTAGSWTGTGAVGVTGQVNLVGTNGATFYITGVQLEKGSTATSFDYRPYGTELALCQRYYQTTYSSSLINNVAFFASLDNIGVGSINWKVSMRAAPTTTVRGDGSGAANGTVRQTTTGSLVGTTGNLNSNVGTEGAGFLSIGAVLTVGQMFDFQYTASAEL